MHCHQTYIPCICCIFFLGRTSLCWYFSALIRTKTGIFLNQLVSAKDTIASVRNARSFHFQVLWQTKYGMHLGIRTISDNSVLYKACFMFSTLVATKSMTFPAICKQEKQNLSNIINRQLVLRGHVISILLILIKIAGMELQP